jgi:hypothetical protein
MRLPTFLLLLLIACAARQSAYAQITVLGGDLLLQVGAPALPQDPLSVVNTATSLQWNRQTVVQKITVSTSCPGQKFSLKVYALNSSEGIAAPEVTLTNGMPDIDFITNCPRMGAKINTAILQYTASATFSQGNSVEVGNDNHIVTYTILEQ